METEKEPLFSLISFESFQIDFPVFPRQLRVKSHPKGRIMRLIVFE